MVDRLARPVIGAIADDFTGATDLAGQLVRHGLRTVQVIGVPSPGGSLADELSTGVDAIVVALKTRTAPVDEALADSLAALAWLRAAGCTRFVSKVCSTFDSTPAGNIGPIAEALMDALGADLAIACPAFPANARTVYQGHLFVGDALLSDTGMREHPLTPMTDPNLVRVLQAQSRRRVGLLAWPDVAAGPDAVTARLARLRDDGIGLAIADAIDDRDLVALGLGAGDLPLVVAGSGLAVGLAARLRAEGRPCVAAEVAATLPPVRGASAVIAGSCSVATRAQVAAMRERHPSWRVDPLDAARSPQRAIDDALAWASGRLGDAPVLVYATAMPDEVRAAQQQLGVTVAGEAVEAVLAGVARGLVERGVRRLIVAGGETSGAVVRALGVSALRIGPEIDPGVPWTVTMADRAGCGEAADEGDAGANVAATVPDLALALKSGNFGTEDFFLKAWDRLA